MNLYLFGEGVIMGDNIKIAIFSTLSGGSNTFFLYKQIPPELRLKYDIRLMTLDEANQDPDIHDYDVYITTHGDYHSSPQKINIELWHGFPLKGMATMDYEESISSESIHRYWSNVDLIMSYSPLYNTLLNSCMGARINQYRVTGMPRNDALFDTGAKRRLLKLFPEISDQKVAFFLPTFRQSLVNPDKSEGIKKFDNLFGFDQFDSLHFSEFLNTHNLSFIIKLHPFEERFFIDNKNKWENQGIYFLTNQMLQAEEIDLYEILGAADLLLTDYSSVYFDYLLLDRPIIFLPVDLDSYRSARGLLLEPYDLWTPGPKAVCQEEMEQAISKSLTDLNWYATERETILRMTHTYKDNGSAKRVWQEIDQYIQHHQTRSAMEIKKKEELALLQHRVKQQIKEWIEAGEWKQATTAIQGYLQSAAADEEIISMLGIAQLFDGTPQSALNTLSAGIRLFPNHADICYNLAYVYETLGQHNSAIHYYETSRQLTTERAFIAEIDDRLLTVKSNLGVI